MTTDMVIDNYLFCVIVVGEMHYKLMRILITSCCSTVAIQVSSTMRILHFMFHENLLTMKCLSRKMRFADG